jgi:S1-C subfamily serine protease
MSEQMPPQPEQQPSLLPPTEQPQQPPVWAPVQPAPPPPAHTVWSRVAAWIVLVAVVAAGAGAGIGFSLARAINNNHNIAQQLTPTSSPLAPVSPATGGNNASVDAIVAAISPSIVDINTTVGSSQAAGTGMIVSPNGEILTNNHVVEGSTSITVTVQGRSDQYTAHVVGVNDSQDVAVIQIDQSVSGLPTVQFADSSSVKVGDNVIAIGNALGRGGAPHATQGQVTALDQTITASEGGGSSETLRGMIQSDATIYPGDSGGALVNSASQVIGMITAGEAQGFRSASDTGYAIAANTAIGIVNQVRSHDQSADITYGQVGFLGVSVQTLDQSSAADLGLNVSSGALVTQVQSGTPAANAGITRSSVITKLGDANVTSADTLGKAIRSHKPGDSVTVTWVNTSGTHNATVSLAGVNP